MNNLKDMGAMDRKIEYVDDFEDDSRPPMVDWVEKFLDGIFAGAGAAMLVCVLYLVIVEYMR